MKTKFIPIVFAAVSAFFNLYAGDITIRQIPVAKQLPSNTGYRMFQDREGFVWVGTTDGFCRYDGYEMKSFRSEITNPSFPSNYITGGFAEDTLNNCIWIGTDKGVLIMDKETERLTLPDRALLGNTRINQLLCAGDDVWVCADDGLFLYGLDGVLKKKYLNNNVNSIHVDRRGTIRVTIWNGGLYRLNKATDRFIPYPGIGEKNNPHKIFQDKGGCLWVCTWGDGLYRFYPDRQGEDMYEQIKFRDNRKNDHGIFFDIEQDDNGYFWTLSYAGVSVFKPEGRSGTLVDSRAEKINHITSLFSSIMKDRDKNLWLGTFNQGLILINPNSSTVINCDLEAIKTQTGYLPNILTICEDKDGELWLKQGRIGMYLYDRESRRVRKPDVFTGVDVGNAICNCSASDEIWVATDYVPHICRFRKSKGEAVRLETIDLQAFFAENAKVVQFLHEDRKGGMWVATPNLLFWYRQNRWQAVDCDFGTITGMTEDSCGTIWLSTAGNGLWQIVPEGDQPKLKNYTTDGCPIAGNHTSCVSADADGRVWFCVNEKQIYCYDVAKQAFTDYTQKTNSDGLIVFNIIAVDKTHIWISSDKQVLEFNPLIGSSIQYDIQHDLVPTSLHRNSVAQLHDGAVVFGGNKGFCILRSSPKLNLPDKKTKTVISDIKVNGNSVYHRDADRPHRRRQQEFVLMHNETNLEINFSSFNYPDPGKTKYAYKMEGVDGQWIYPESGRNFAVYNQLRKGKYTFLVKTTESNHLWSNEITRLVIIKKPKPYETSWAYAGYILVVLLIVYAIVRFYTNRLKLRNELHLIRMDKEKSEELIQTKLRFFTNIGHEFRTPLTLIMTPLNIIIRKLTDENLKQKLSAIYRNAEDLLGLINQLLDFRKLEMGGEKLKPTCDDFVKFAKYVHLAFYDLAKNKSIAFTFESDVKQCFLSFDKSKVRKVMNNLYSNALKYTPEDGFIGTTVRLEKRGGREYIRLDVADSGTGIPEKELQSVFERFYQSEKNAIDKTGSGIGLHLAKEYIELHNGRITVDSKIGEGSVFSVLIPTDLQPSGCGDTDTAATLHPMLQQEASESDDRQEKRTVLIVEDNTELRHFLAEQFEEQFDILQAGNGKQGMKIALKKCPDLIVSDLAMPLMDGLEMCHCLKNDIQTSHIPIILLTAHLSDDAKIGTYKAGADSYIAKPFNFDVLQARIEMLIEQQEKRKKLFHKTIEITPSSITTTSIDEELIKNALIAVEESIDNSAFSVDELSLALGISRRQLSRKFRSVIGLSPVAFIRSVRMKRAAQLLADSQCNISEVAYMVGYGTVKYFNQHFKEEFGLTPSQYREHSAPQLPS
ncbi:MAG: helix-turn-helix domain-containing protein [Prevotellaceae bacterium]|jgi:signal transduction histidine kinase/DNA-binding response OmpR family regulator/ligand-binding sensor domain-containing protein|nr:helix-turn-helix domain-containing protein [Prevotellaceae bacterium]